MTKGFFYSYLGNLKKNKNLETYILMLRTMFPRDLRNPIFEKNLFEKNRISKLETRFKKSD